MAEPEGQRPPGIMVGLSLRVSGVQVGVPLKTPSLSGLEGRGGRVGVSQVATRRRLIPFTVQTVSR